MKEHLLIVENDEHPTEGPHPTDAEMRKCSVCGYTRRDAPSALMVCCGQPMEVEPHPRRIRPMPTSKDEAQDLNDNKRSGDDRRDETERRRAQEDQISEERRAAQSRRSGNVRRKAA